MLKPLFDRLIVKMVDVKDTTQSGIILTSSAKDKTQIAEVIEVGQGGKMNGEEIQMCVKKGDKVLLARYAGTEIKYENQDFVVVKQNDVLAIVE